MAVGFSGETQISDDGGASFATIGPGIAAAFGVTGVRATSANVAHAFGSSGALARTVDGGETWASVGVPTEQAVLDVWFPTAELGYAIDDGGGSVPHGQRRRQLEHP